MATNPSIVSHLEDDLRHAIRVWIKQKESGSRDKERLARGVVRGLAQALLLILRPYEHNDKNAIAHVEKQYGLTGRTPSNPKDPEGK